jgi:hypothetical protein
MTSPTIAELNDTFRQTFMGRPVMLTSGVRSLPSDTLKTVLRLVRAFDAFTPDNDPYGEHDFGAFDCHGQRIFWKIDYYDSKLTYGSEYPEDPEQTTRVLTIMLAEEY